jgi:hypothetical protein
LYLFHPTHVVGLVDLQDAFYHTPSQSVMMMVHTILRDVNGGDDFQILRDLVGKSDGGIWHRNGISHHYVKIPTIHLINMIL